MDCSGLGLDYLLYIVSDHVSQSKFSPAFASHVTHHVLDQQVPRSHSCDTPSHDYTS